MRKNTLYSAIITGIAVPLWFIGLCLFWSRQNYDINAPGIVLYFGLQCLIAIPFALFVSFVIAPSLTELKTKPRFHAVPVITIAHAVPLLGLYLIYKFASTAPSSDWINLLVIPFYLLLFLTPPSWIGCSLYALLSNKKPQKSP